MLAESANRHNRISPEATQTIDSRSKLTMLTALDYANFATHANCAGWLTC